MPSNFDQTILRSNTASLKHDHCERTFGSADLIPMWVADMDFAAPEGVTQALLARAAHPVYGYSVYPDSMYQALIDWMQTHHQYPIERNWLVMCPGVVPAIHACILALTEVGDGVIVQTPVYAPFFTSLTTTGRRVVRNPLRLEQGRYQMDFDHLEQCAASGASLLILCSPHNPIGRVWTRDELLQLLAICRRYQITILSDEIHADLLYPGVNHTALATLAGEGDRVLTAVAPSKTFNIPGLGLSALIVPDAAARSAVRKVFDQLHIQASNPFSVTAFEAAYRTGEAWRQDLLQYLQQTRVFVRNYLAQYLPQIQLIEPEGTYLLWLDCRAMGLDDKALQQFFVQQAKVAMSPGTIFGEEGSGFMRMNIGVRRAEVARALDAIRDSWANYAH